MTVDVAHAVTWLFTPGDRPDRFARADAAGADVVVLDLEDAVPADAKDAARRHVRDWIRTGRTAVVRINGTDSPWFHADVAAVGDLGVPLMLPKAAPDQVAMVTESRGATDGRSGGVVALVESARGVQHAAALAALPAVRRLAFGSLDLAAEIGVDPEDRTVLAPYRALLVLASASASLPAPVDGVTAAVRDEQATRIDAVAARREGFGAKLCIHPDQVPVVTAAFGPTPAELDWARQVLATADGVATVAGRMVDKPVRDRARLIMERSGRLEGDRGTDESRVRA